MTGTQPPLRYYAERGLLFMYTKYAKKALPG